MGERASSFDVCEERCDQCLFSKERVVNEPRLRQILSDCARKDTHFVCHKFTIASMEGQDVSDQTCCRGFYDTNVSTNLMRIAERLGVVRFVPLPPEPEGVEADNQQQGAGS